MNLKECETRRAEAALVTVVSMLIEVDSAIGTFFLGALGLVSLVIFAYCNHRMRQ